MQAKKVKIFYPSKQKLTVCKRNILIKVIRKLRETTHDKGIIWSKRIKYINVLVILEPFSTGHINRQCLKAAFSHQKNCLQLRIIHLQLKKSIYSKTEYLSIWIGVRVLLQKCFALHCTCRFFKLTALMFGYSKSINWFVIEGFTGWKSDLRHP